MGLSRLASLVVLAVLPIAARAVDEFTLVDGDATFTHRNLEGERLTGLGGRGRFSVAGVENPTQHWFWYRAGADTRDYALSNQTEATVSGNFAELQYVEPVAGFGPDALRFVQTYELTQTGPNSAFLTIAFGVLNQTTSAIDLTLSSYLDTDLNETAGDDSAAVSGEENEVQTIVDSLTGSSLVYSASTRRLNAFEVAPYSSILDSLTDNGATVYSNSAFNFGPGDYTGGYQWQSTITPGRLIFIGAVTLDLNAVPEPGTLLILGGLLAWTLKRRRR
ncbi:MAG: PEP-CTERM sorting domain-containing protein [Fimbriimonadaceae bacterium]|nr:PEP-CTERM sorting domain-containing protein [Fimbriimonadaceae bacterium]QYK58733.1 MAG: PEP-CTERM sorting domain-containing protein [Fimbriimonadaceae bacterium]